MKRKVYVVTSVLANRKSCTSGPVLGVHSSMKKARKHYELCVQTQSEYPGSTLVRDENTSDYNRKFEMAVREALICHEDKSSSTIALQVWEI